MISFCFLNQIDWLWSVVAIYSRYNHQTDNSTTKFTDKMFIWTWNEKIQHIPSVCFICVVLMSFNSVAIEDFWSSNWAFGIPFTRSSFLRVLFFSFLLKCFTEYTKEHCFIYTYLSFEYNVFHIIYSANTRPLTYIEPSSSRQDHHRHDGVRR